MGDSDELLRREIDDLMADGERTVVVLYGDHMMYGRIAQTVNDIKTSLNNECISIPFDFMTSELGVINTFLHGVTDSTKCLISNDPIPAQFIRWRRIRELINKTQIHLASLYQNHRTVTTPAKIILVTNESPIPYIDYGLRDKIRLVHFS
jgi:hypothetical protein